MLHADWLTLPDLKNKSKSLTTQACPLLSPAHIIEPVKTFGQNSLQIVSSLTTTSTDRSVSGN